MSISIFRIHQILYAEGAVRGGGSHLGIYMPFCVCVCVRTTMRRITLACAKFILRVLYLVAQK